MTGDIPMFDVDGNFIEPDYQSENVDYSEHPGGLVIETYEQAYPAEEIQVDTPI